MPVERLRREGAAPLVEVARAWQTAELLTELTQEREQLLAGDEPPRHEPRGPLGRVPGPEVLDHGLGMDAGLGVGRELLHRR